MDTSELVTRYPRLFHMAAAGSWPAIRRHGLLTAEQIVRSSDLVPEVAAAALTQRRPASLAIAHPVLGDVTIRDQTPLRLHILMHVLDDLSVEQWLHTLNSRVFFWLHTDRLERLLAARRSRDEEHDVLTVDTAALLEHHRDRVRLSPINSGATLYPNAPRRGAQTFSTVADYPFAARRRGRSDADAVTELAVLDGVPDLARFVVSAERRRGAAHLFDLPL